LCDGAIVCASSQKLKKAMQSFVTMELSICFLNKSAMGVVGPQKQ
jgi:hypothetical protein